jgi:hypothetical protein
MRRRPKGGQRIFDQFGAVLVRVGQDGMRRGRIEDFVHQRQRPLPGILRNAAGLGRFWCGRGGLCEAA